MTETTHALLVVDRLQDLRHAPRVSDASLQAAVDRTLDTAAETEQTVMDRLRVWQQDYAHSMAPATQRAVRADWGVYIAWCETKGSSPLPADVDQLYGFVQNAIARGRKRSTLVRYINTIALIHKSAGLPNPVTHYRWPLLRKALLSKKLPKARRSSTQAAPLKTAQLTEILSTLGESPRDRRDAAMLSLASDTMVRESELVQVHVEHLRSDPGTGQTSLLVPFSKTVREGSKDYRHVSPETMALIARWKLCAGIESGVLFRSLGNRTPAHILAARKAGVPEPPHYMGPQEVARIFGERAKQAGVNDINGRRFTGHSTRVGSAIELDEAGFATSQIQKAGNWKTPKMVDLYTSEARTGRNAMATLRRKQRRAKPASTDPQTDHVDQG